MQQNQPPRGIGEVGSGFTDQDGQENDRMQEKKSPG